ncbi:MAG: hypothetical protein KF830_18465 [Planctomycetes bacterium]|nr:hypothetical protein [Planctomycetota bacterium]
MVTLPEGLRRLAIVGSALLVAGTLACQRDRRAADGPPPMLPAPSGNFAAEPTDDGSTLRIRRRTDAAGVALPYCTITAAAWLGERLGDEILVAGVRPDGGFEYRSVTFAGDAWTAAAQGAATFPAYVAQMSCAHGRLAVLLGDGSILTAPCLDAEDLPTEEEFERVGAASAGVRQHLQLSAVSVTAFDRIEVFQHPGHRPAFVRQASGEWKYDLERQEGLDVLEVETPARLPGRVRFRSTLAGPVVLAAEGTSWSVPVADGPTADGWGVLPADVSAALRAERRYRLQAQGRTGAWFHPAVITGEAWCVAGARLQECRVLESGVRAERGGVAFRTTLELEPGSAIGSVRKVAFVAVSGASAPPVVERGGRTWLVPERALQVDRVLAAGRTAFALAVPVPLPAAGAAEGQWVHVQLVVRSAAGTLLGATGVRSVPILRDEGTHTAAQEAAGRRAAADSWSAHGIAAVGPFWEEVVSR